VIWLLLAACGLPPDPDGVQPAGADLQPLPPDLGSATLDCDLDSASWRMELTVDGWAGRVRSWWSADGLYVEDHLVPSQSYAPDGTGQDFLLTLSISPDFRLVEEGSATALSCGADPSVLVVIDDLDGAVHTCHDFAPLDPAGAVDWSTVEGLPDCP
jgi:hypothetical protein